MTQQTVPYKINLPRDLKSWVQNAAKRDDRSQSAQIIRILRKEMEAQENETS
jgi:hypothetical protein